MSELVLLMVLVEGWPAHSDEE